MPTPLQGFLDSLDGWAPREEVYDLDAAARLAPDDRVAAEDALLVRAQHGDRRAALTLGALGAVRVLPQLLAIATHPDGVGPFARRAVLELAPSNGTASAVLGDLASMSSYDRIAAVEALGKHGGPVARKGLDRALDDADPIVRRRASMHLLKIAGLFELTRTPDGSDSEPVAPLEHLCWLLSSDLKATHRHAAAELRRILVAVAAGQTPTELDLVYRPGPDARFRLDLSDALGEPDDPIPLDLVCRNGDHARRFAETVLTLRLDPENRDPRAPGALADLGATWTRASMDEAAAGLPATDKFAAAVAAARARLAD